MPSRDYQAIARNAILDLLDRELALFWLEVEAKLAGPPYSVPGGGYLPDGINPHHLTSARAALVAEGVLVPDSAPTRGARRVTVWVPTDQRLRRTAIAVAARRKRALASRYLGWANARADRPSLVGEAGERVARQSLLEAAASGYRILPTSKVGVRRLLGQDVEGPLDAAAHLVTEVGGFPVALTIPIEVKNIREWIYPDSSELFQLIHKAAVLQLAHPERGILPVLVCRRAHYTARQMAKQLGFFIASANAQFILPYADVVGTPIAEVRAELGFADLEAREGSHPLLQSLFAKTIPDEAPEASARFSRSAQLLVRYAGELRSTQLPTSRRAQLMDQLRSDAREIPDYAGRW